MATGRGLGIETDGLVFYYDTGNSIDSYLGEPTVNLASNANFSNGTTNWNANQNVTLSVETVNGTRFFKVKSNQTTSTPGFISDNITVSGNTTYTLTIRAYKNDSNGIWLYATGDGTGGSSIVWTSANGPNPITTELTTISRTFTTPSDMTYLRIGALWSNPLTTSEVYVEYMQLEQKSHATPFVNGTRSVSGSLLDISGQGVEVDVANASFDSNAQMTFDGTDDYALAPISPSKTLYCLETVFYNVNAIPGNETAIGGPTTYQSLFRFNQDYPMGVNLGGWTGGLTNEAIHIWSTGTVPYYATSTRETVPSGWHHLVFNWNGSYYDIYVDGVQQPVYAHSDGHATLIELDHLTIGNHISPNYAFNGDINIVKAYNRALTAAEVKRNYNAIKTRFGL